MPEWHETAPAVLQQVSPTEQDVQGGHRRRRQLAVGGLHRLRAHADEVAVERQGRADQRHRDPEPGRLDVGLRDVRLPGRRRRGAVALIQRGTCAFTLKLENAVKAGAVGVILFNEGDTAGRTQRAVPLGAPGLHDPGRAFELRRRRGALQRLQGRSEPDGQPRHQRRRRRRSSTRTWSPRPSAATRTTWCFWARTWTRSRQARASTTTDRARRSSSSSPSSWPSRARRRATRSASCGSAARRTAWSARSTTPPTCPTPTSRART